MSQVMYPTHYENAIKARIWGNANKTFRKTFGEERVSNVITFLTGETSKGSPFPLWRSFMEAYNKYGKLTEKQMVCVENSIAKREAKKATKDQEIAEKNAKSNFIGQIGEKVTLDLVVKSITSYDRRCFGYYDRGYTIVYIMTDANDNIVVYKASSGGMGFKNGNTGERGDHVRVTATIKDHADYKGTKQTIIMRPKWELTLRPYIQIDEQVEEI